MKKIRFILLFVFCMLITTNVDAANFSVSTSPSNVTVGGSYTAYINYSGTTLGSATYNVSITNATCSVTSSISNVYSNKGSIYEVTLPYKQGGYPSGRFMTLNCNATSVGTSKIAVSLSGGDAWDEEGMNSVRVNSASASVTVNAAPTTTSTTQAQTKTTTTNAPVQTTVQKTQAQVTTKKGETTTTKKGETTTKVTTTQNTEIVNNQEGVVEETTTMETTTSTTTKKPSLEDLILNEFKIVGYDVKYDLNVTTYRINIAEDVDSIYVICKPQSEDTTVSGDGLIDIKNKDSVVITLYNSKTGNTIDLKIEFSREKESKVNIIPFIITFLIGGVIGAIGTMFMTKGMVDKLDHDKTAVFDPIVPSNKGFNKATNEEVLITKVNTDVFVTDNIDSINDDLIDEDELSTKTSDNQIEINDLSNISVSVNDPITKEIINDIEE